MRHLLLVGGGGFLGSVAHDDLTRLVTQGVYAARFPYGTLVVNVLYFLGREHAGMARLVSVALQVMLGLAAVWAGHQMVRGA